MQCIVTTHSPVAVSELNTKSTFVVRSSPPDTIVIPVDDGISRTLKKVPEAILARRILVCEGKTEMGFCLGLDAAAGDGRERSISYQGIALVDGSGAETLSRNKNLALQALASFESLLSDAIESFAAEIFRGAFNRLPLLPSKTAPANAMVTGGANCSTLISLCLRRGSKVG